MTQMSVESSSGKLMRSLKDSAENEHQIRVGEAFQAKALPFQRLPLSPPRRDPVQFLDHKRVGAPSRSHLSSLLCSCRDRWALGWVRQSLIFEGGQGMYPQVLTSLGFQGFKWVSPIQVGGGVPWLGRERPRGLGAMKTYAGHQTHEHDSYTVSRRRTKPSARLSTRPSWPIRRTSIASRSEPADGHRGIISRIAEPGYLAGVSFTHAGGHALSDQYPDARGVLLQAL
jgi:hypothetical protein